MTLFAICLSPWADHLLTHPSLLGDDTQRVEDLQIHPFSRLITRPFNEHLAPLFETVSWVTWMGAGRRLTAAPMAFTVASYIPFLLSLLALGSLARRVLGSWAGGGIVVALFALTPAYAEVVYWYSASSFAWALAATCLAIEAADRARESGRRRWAALSGLMTFVSPCFSSIGLLAGPAAIAMGWPRRIARGAWLPPLSTAFGISAYLILSVFARQYVIVAHSVGQNARLAQAVPWMLKAPLYLLASGPLAVPRAVDWPTAPGAVALAFATLVLVGWFVGGGPRRLIVASGVLIAGGYLLTYPFRVEIFPGREILIAGRYHLYPMAGLSLILGAAIGPAIGRLEQGRRWLAAALVIGLASALALANGPAIRTRAIWHTFPEQASTLRGVERLASICRDRGITREQALARLDPILARWNNPRFNSLRLLPITVNRASVTNEAVRSTIVGSLDPRERRCLFAGTEISSRLVSASAWGGGRLEASPGVLVSLERVRPTGALGWFDHAGGQAYLEYSFHDAVRPSAIRLVGLIASGDVQLWWNDASGGWSRERSVTLSPARPGEALANVVLPYSEIPHWQPGEGDRIRFVFHHRGSIALFAPESVHPSPVRLR